MKRKLEYTVLAAVLLFVLWAGGVHAGPVWICSITRAVECVEDGTVGEPDFGGIFRAVVPEPGPLTLQLQEAPVK